LTTYLITRYLQYLDAFASKYDLIKNIQFKTVVEEIRKCPKTGKWLVTVRGGQAVKAHRTYGGGELFFTEYVSPFPFPHQHQFDFVGGGRGHVPSYVYNVNQTFLLILRWKL